jgi:hypothetical protein
MDTFLEICANEEWIVSMRISYKKTHLALCFALPCLFYFVLYRGADKSLAQPTSRCILFDGENISFDASLVLYIYIYKQY